MNTKSIINTPIRLCLLLLTLVISVVNVRADNLESLILGKWTSSFITSVPSPGFEGDIAVLKCSGNEEYFPNKTCSSDGTLGLLGKFFDDEKKLHNIKVLYEIRMTSEWSVVGGIVYDKITDSAVTLSKLWIDEKEITDRGVLDAYKKESQMEKLFLKGQTTPTKTISIDANKWVYEVEMEKGKKVIVKATRP